MSIGNWERSPCSGSSLQPSASDCRDGSWALVSCSWSHVLGGVLSLRRLLRRTRAALTGLSFCLNVDVCVPRRRPGGALMWLEMRSHGRPPLWEFPAHDERTEVENPLTEFQSNPGSPSPAQVHSLIHFWPLVNFSLHFKPIQINK